MIQSSIAPVVLSVCRHRLIQCLDLGYWYVTCASWPYVPWLAFPTHVPHSLLLRASCNMQGAGTSQEGETDYQNIRIVWLNCYYSTQDTAIYGSDTIKQDNELYRYYKTKATCTQYNSNRNHTECPQFHSHYVVLGTAAYVLVFFMSGSTCASPLRCGWTQE